MAHFRTLQRLLLRALAAGTKSPAEVDPEEADSLLAKVISTAESLEETLGIIAGARKIMLNQRVDVTDEEEAFLLENDIHPERHHLFRGYASLPRILTLAEIEAQALRADGPREKLAAVLVSPSDLVFLTFLTH
jgi:hypothetical protein